jgi:hypothetical protein
MAALATANHCTSSTSQGAPYTLSPQKLLSANTLKLCFFLSILHAEQGGVNGQHPQLPDDLKVDPGQ